MGFGLITRRSQVRILPPLWPYGWPRNNLSSLLDGVSNRHDHVLVARNGAPAAALVPIDEWGETVTLAELRSELAERRPAAS